MAANAAVAIGSSFSSSINTVKHVRSKNKYPDVFLKVSSSRMSHFLPQSHAIEAVHVGAISRSSRLPRISAAVAQDEVAVTDEAEAGLAQDNELEEEGGEQPVSAVSTKLYFGNLPYSVDSAQLAGIIQEYGSAELIEVLYNKQTGKSRGFAFVTMSTIEDCNAVIENLDGNDFMGRILRVNFSDKPRPKEPLYPETEHKLFVGNLSWSVTSDILKIAFEEYGNVVGARVLYDGETGKSLGYGFVCYATRQEMEVALESLNGMELEGRPMRVTVALGKSS